MTLPSSAARFNDTAVFVRLPVTPVMPVRLADFPAPSTVTQRRAVLPASTRSVTIAAAISTSAIVTPTAACVPAPVPAKPPRSWPPIVSTSAVAVVPSASVICCEKPLTAKLPEAWRNPPATSSPPVTPTPNVPDFSVPNV